MFQTSSHFCREPSVHYQIWPMCVVRDMADKCDVGSNSCFLTVWSTEWEYQMTDCNFFKPLTTFAHTHSLPTIAERTITRRDTYIEIWIHKSQGNQQKHMANMTRNHLWFVRNRFLLLRLFDCWHCLDRFSLTFTHLWFCTFHVRWHLHILRQEEGGV